jgi:hypothetical protein
MPSKEKSYKEKENEKTRGKKRYLERIVDEREAEKQIKEFDREEVPDEDLSDEGRTYRHHGNGPERNQRS